MYCTPLHFFYQTDKVALCIYFFIKSCFTIETLCALFNHLNNLSLFSLGKNANFSVMCRHLDGDVFPHISNVVLSDNAVSAVDSH